MAKGIYVASAEPLSDKSIVVLGMMELLWNKTRKVSFFKPVVSNLENDPTINLIISRYKLDASCNTMCGVTHEVAHELIAANKHDELIKRIMEIGRASCRERV